VASSPGLTQDEKSRIEEMKARAARYFNKDDYRKAIPILKKILEINPQDERASLYLLISQQRIVEPYCQQGSKAFQAADYPSAISFWENILRINPEDRRAVDLIEMARQVLSKQNTGVLYRRAGELFAKDDYEGAAEQWKKILRMNPFEERARDLLESTEDLIRDRKLKRLYGKADELKAAGNLDGAIDEWNKILTIDPGQERASHLLSEAYAELLQDIYRTAEKALVEGRYAAGRDAYYKIMANNPTDKEVRGVIDRIAKVIGVMPSAEGNGRGIKMMRRGVIQFIRNDGDAKVAIAALRYAEQLSPGETKISEMREMVERERVAALRTMEKPAKDMNVVEQKLFIALNHIYDGRYDLAIEECNTVLYLEPRNLTALKRLGSAYYALGKKDKAREAWKRALALAPNDKEIKSFLRSR
jgi:tetratricopeptide (TPR) repeat protein